MFDPNRKILLRHLKQNLRLLISIRDLNQIDKQIIIKNPINNRLQIINKLGII